MSVLLDYLDWRGDLSFQVDPVNEADYYLISKIGCPDLTGLVPSDAQEVPLPEVVASFRAQTGNQDVSLGVSQSPQVMESFYRLPSVPRFQPLSVSFVFPFLFPFPAPKARIMTAPRIVPRGGFPSFSIPIKINRSFYTLSAGCQEKAVLARAPQMPLPCGSSDDGRPAPHGCRFRP